MSAKKYFSVFLLINVLVYAAGESEEVVEEGPVPISEEDFDSERVAGGVSTTVEKFPYQVAISVANSTLCGGFILSASWVMSAARCVDGASPEDISIRAGSSIFNSGGIVFQAADSVVHALYNFTRNNDYDFAVIKINGTFPFSNAIKAIAIPAQNNRLPLIGKITVAGWGLTSDSSSFSPTLRAVSVSLVGNRICGLLYRRITEVTPRMFCAGRFLFGGLGSCQGDIGGAAVYNNMAIGIASFGLSCGSIIPAVFANVASVTEWVRGVTGI